MLDDLKNMINEDLNIDRTKLSIESSENPLLYTKYAHLRSEAKLEIKKCELEKRAVYQKRWYYYSGKGSGKVSPIIYTAAELKKVIDNDSEVVNYDKKMTLLELKLDIIEEAVKAFSMRGFSLANIIKWEIFSNGG